MYVLCALKIIFQCLQVYVEKSLNKKQTSLRDCKEILEENHHSHFHQHSNCKQKLTSINHMVNKLKLKVSLVVKVNKYEVHYLL